MQTLYCWPWLDIHHEMEVVVAARLCLPFGAHFSVRAGVI